MVGSLDQGLLQLVLIIEYTLTHDLMEPPALYLQGQPLRYLPIKRGHQRLFSNKPTLTADWFTWIVHKLIDKCIMNSLPLNTVELKKKTNKKKTKVRLHVWHVFMGLMFSSVLKKPTNHVFEKICPFCYSDHCFSLELYQQLTDFQAISQGKDNNNQSVGLMHSTSSAVNTN